MVFVAVKEIGRFLRRQKRFMAEKKEELTYGFCFEKSTEVC